MPPYTSTITSTSTAAKSGKEVTEEVKECQTLEQEQPKKYKCFLGEFETEIIWFNTIMIIALHVFVIVYLFPFPWSQKYYLIPYHFIFGGLGGFGVTAGAHRYFTHRSFKAKTPLKLILLICYSIAGQNTIYDWVRDHRVHHKFSETDADPHNSKRGFFFAHVGWLMMKKHPEVLKKGKLIDCSDVLADPIVAFHQKHFSIFKFIFAFFIPSVIPVIFFQECWFWAIASNLLRYVFNLNFTWFVNSAAHMYGIRPYDKNMAGTENIPVTIVAMGEGFHNYHHVFPWDYKAAELGNYNTNVTTFWLDMFGKIGWAYDFKSASKDLVKKVVEKHGDGSHTVYGHDEIPYEENEKTL